MNEFSRAAKKNPVGFGLKLAGTIGTIELLTHMMGSKEENKEEYEAFPNWVKRFFWPVKVDGTWVTIPKPYGYGQIGSMMGTAMRWNDETNPGTVSEMFGHVLQGFTPVDSATSVLPTTLKLMAEVMSNENFFRDAPIFSPHKENLIAELQSNRHTPQLYKDAGRVFNVSPAKIEHSVRGLLGPLGAETVSEVSKAVTDAPVKPSDPELLDSIPLAKGFVARNPIGGSQQMQILRNALAEIDGVGASYNQLVKNFKTSGQEKDLVRADKYFDDNPIIPSATGTNSAIGSIKKELGKMDDMIDLIVNDRGMGDDEKRKQIREIELLRHRSAKDWIKILKEIGWFR